jgi:thiol-disulfide isomerase/thioredoxin
MIRSRLFWAAAICLAALPLLVMDIPKHYIDWTHDVHDEMINTVQNQYALTHQQRTAALDNILEANGSLMAKMYIKSFAAIVLLAMGITLFVRYQRQYGNGLKAVGIGVMMLFITIGLKFYLWMGFTGTDQIQFLSLSPTDTSITAICKTHFKNKVVYVDFWGTTCGPCLEEFRDFTHPLKQHFKSREDIAYLYVCSGYQVLWKQQVQKLNINGTHLFLNAADYSRFFKQAVKGDKDTMVAMPRYLIIGKNGEVASTNAPRPSDIKSVITLLTQQLTDNPTPAKSQTHEQHI